MSRESQDWFVHAQWVPLPVIQADVKLQDGVSPCFAMHLHAACSSDGRNTHEQVANKHRLCDELE